MNFRFKRHQFVSLKNSPNPEYVEYEYDFNSQNSPIKKGMKAQVNLIMPNGSYHVRILNNNEETIAYALFSEEELEDLSQ